MILEPWFIRTNSADPANNYRHALLTEDISLRDEYFDALKSYVYNAHNDARLHLLRIVGLSLDPLEEESEILDGYPSKLHLNTLKGYMGEVLAALYAYSCSPHEESNWQVPAFLFTFHDIAFDQIWTWQQSGTIPGKAPGQSGDDCLAFTLDSNGNIEKILVCEAKCSASHRSIAIREAHENISRPELKPVSIRKVIEILLERGDDDSLQWVEALRRLMLGPAPDGYERCDLVVYVHGRRPASPSSNWMSNTSPHSSYTAGRKLEAVEMHINGVEALIRRLYDAT